MKKNKKLLFVGFLAMLMIAFLSGPAISADSVTIMGTVTDDYLLTDNDQVYYIGEGEKGDEVTQHVGKKVKLAGMVEEIDEDKIITVTSYEIIGE
ncbi:MAG: hypothetical protein H8E19_10875 [Deltaproteobacteria bacterium]|uniref:NirD/YgiW/YdeI family stress tolerance protein n=1 Tax=Candidatus Desulfacyla euxinica TaxID=2841693 RepID=A0A8J6N0J1_9DELT|nr:hypothetical protein [Candidatus Desulfacyla euxinica]MBL7218080.1 hypothetical protein [Desulfobacteraceae bacterium]